MSEILKPLHDMVILTFEKKQTDSSVIVVEDKPSNQATVLAVGPGRVLTNGKRMPMPLIKGDRVLVGRYAGYQYELSDGPVRVVNLQDIQAVL